MKNLVVILRELKQASTNFERGEIILSNRGIVKRFPGQIRRELEIALEGDFADPQSISALGAWFGHV